jgi:hypothetical protein
MEDEVFDPEQVEKFPDENALEFHQYRETVSAEDYDKLLALYRQTKFALQLAEGDEGYEEGKWMREALNYGQDFTKPVQP